MGLERWLLVAFALAIALWVIWVARPCPPVGTPERRRFRRRLRDNGLMAWTAVITVVIAGGFVDLQERAEDDRRILTRQADILAEQASQAQLLSSQQTVMQTQRAEAVALVCDQNTALRVVVRALSEFIAAEPDLPRDRPALRALAETVSRLEAERCDELLADAQRAP